MENNYYSVTGHISNSSLKLLKRPKDFYEYLVGVYKNKEASYLTFGTMFHMYVLERERFEEEVKVYDFEKPRSAQQKLFCDEYASISKGKVEEKLLKAYKAAYDSKEAEDKLVEKAKALKNKYKDFFKYLRDSKKYTVISVKDMNRIESMWQALYRHKKGYELVCRAFGPVDVQAVHNETAFYWERDKIKYKALVDRIIVDESTKTIQLIDLKTTVDLTEFEADYDKYRYDVQLAFYSLAILEAGEKTLGLEHPIDDYTLDVIEVVVDKITSEVKVIKLNEPELTQGFQKLKRDLDLAKWHLKNDKWDYSREYYEGDGFETL